MILFISKTAGKGKSVLKSVRLVNGKVYPFDILNITSAVITILEIVRY